ncbi:hypothetical protein [Fervidibacillus albus]|uniref:Uncharacterized protein n=1 Tax=Fervidibacillus albus TaxID=2980026 RepID=A0A9E8LS52_9BACI|nr:hypothetical protein [Fervidibacillus albus]WAA08599.1 hypothetical protein OE104_08055 [Fervidibacillus albus]
MNEYGRNTNPFMNHFIDNSFFQKEFSRSDKHTDSFIDSIAHMEKSLAKLLEAEASIITNSPQKEEKDIRKLLKAIDQMLRKIILKEIVMILLMEEKKDGKKKTCKKDHSHKKNRCKTKHCDCHCCSKRKKKTTFHFDENW